MSSPSPEVLYEDNHIIAVNKPAGTLVQGDITGDIPLSEQVRSWIKEKYQKPGNVFTGTIHRLDRPVSGVVLFAKTSKALSRLNEIFRKREIKKIYWALSDKKPPVTEGRLVHFIEKDKSKNKVRVSEQGKKSKKAELMYKFIAGKNGLYLLEIIPHTGRPHQIRVQLSENKTPIAGDKKYGSEYKTGDKNILLHATELQFIHPVKKEPVTIKAPLPDKQEWNFFSHIWE